MSNLSILYVSEKEKNHDSAHTCLDRYFPVTTVSTYAAGMRELGPEVDDLKLASELCSRGYHLYNPPAAGKERDTFDNLKTSLYPKCLKPQKHDIVLTNVSFTDNPLGGVMIALMAMQSGIKYIGLLAEECDEVTAVSYLDTASTNRGDTDKNHRIIQQRDSRLVLIRNRLLNQKDWDPDRPTINWRRIVDLVIG